MSGTKDAVEKKSPEAESGREISEAVTEAVLDGAGALIQAAKKAMEQQMDTENRPANAATRELGGRPEIYDGKDGKTHVHGHNGKPDAKAGLDSVLQKEERPSGPNSVGHVEGRTAGSGIDVGAGISTSVPAEGRSSYRPVSEGRPAVEARPAAEARPGAELIPVSETSPGMGAETRLDAGFVATGKVPNEVPTPAAIGGEWDEAAKSGDFGKVNASMMRAIADAHRKGGAEGVEDLNNKILVDGVKTKDGLPIFVQDGDKVTVHHVKQIDEAKKEVYQQLSDSERKKLGIVDVPGQGLMQEVAPPLTVHLPHKREGSPEAKPVETERPNPGDGTTARPADVEPKTGSEILLDSKSSHEDKLKAALDMAHKGQTEFKGPDGKKYHISTENYKNREGVEIFGDDENGKRHPLLRGLVNNDGSVSHQKDKNGNDVDFVGDYAKKNMKDNAILQHDVVDKKSEPSKTEEPKKDSGGLITPEQQKILDDLILKAGRFMDGLKLPEIDPGFRLPDEFPVTEPLNIVEPGDAEPVWRKDPFAGGITEVDPGFRLPDELPIPKPVNTVEPGDAEPVWRRDTPDAPPDRGDKNFKDWLRGDDDVSVITNILEKCPSAGDIEQTVKAINAAYKAEGSPLSIKLGAVKGNTQRFVVMNGDKVSSEQSFYLPRN